MVVMAFVKIDIGTLKWSFIFCRVINSSSHVIKFAGSVKILELLLQTILKGNINLRLSCIESCFFSAK